MKILKNNPTFNNEYGFVIYEYFRNSYSAPNNRSLIQMIVLVESDGVDKVSFSTKCQQIYEKFLSFYLEHIQSELDGVLCNIEALDEETKAYIEQDIPVESIASQSFIQEIESKSYSSDDKGVVVTLNNYEDMGLDFYYVSKGIILG
jgi:hypothetical protein